MTLIRTKIDGSEYFGPDGEFEPYSLAKKINDKYPVATERKSEVVYLQNGAVWRDDGEQVLRSDLWHILGDAASRSRINEVLSAVKHLSLTDRSEMTGLPPHKVAVDNGVVDLLADDGDEFERDRTGPGTFIRVPVKYDSDPSQPERFNEFLYDVLPEEDVPIMWELIGYCLYRGYPFQRAFMFVGSGANGKSTLLAALRAFLGPENTAAVELVDIAEDRFAPAQLEGKLANLAPDISDEGVEHTGTFKALTGGDRIRADRKYQEPFHFENYAKLIFSANAVPNARDESYAYERRWLYFNFPYTFDSDDSVPQRELLDSFEDEHSAILNRARKAFQDLWERGGFEATTFMKEYETAHDRTVDPTVEFAEDCLIPDDEEYLRIGDAYEEYVHWCSEEGHQPKSQEHFEETVSRVHAPPSGKDPEDRRYKVWTGLRLDRNQSDTVQ